MSGKSGYQKYKETSIQSASREKILLMLYEGAIKFTKRAIAGAEAKKIAERAENICRVYDIVLELNNTLDHNVGGKLASDLEQLYMFVTDQLSKSNATGDAAPLYAALKILEVLHDGWVKAIDSLKKQENVRKAE